MPPSLSLPHARLIRKLESVTRLTDDEKSALGRLPLHLRKLKARDDIGSEGDQPSYCCLLIEGMLHRYKSLPDGTKAVLAYHIPGEIPDLQTLFLQTLDHSIGAVTDCQVAMIPHIALHEVIEARPTVMAALWRETLIDAAIFQEWIVNAGSRPARPRLAHLFCELFDRLRSVGLANRDGFTLPMTQVELGHATGMSAVHLNRIMQELRAGGLIASEGNFLHILDWPKLQETTGYESRYLHLNTSEYGSEANIEASPNVVRPLGLIERAVGGLEQRTPSM